MANYQGLEEWLLNNQEELNIRVTEFNWPHRYNIGLSDFEVSFEVNGYRHEGRGADLYKSVALRKATSEAVERFICYIMGISTIGVAVHESSEKAAAHAKFELIERDGFFCHLLTNTGFREIKAIDHCGASERLEIKTFLVRSIPGMSDLFNLNNLKFSFYKMNSFDGVNSVIVHVVVFPQKRNHIGLGCGPSLEKALQAALLECLRNLTAFLDAPEVFESMTSSFGSSRWFMDRQYLDTIKPLFEINKAGTQCIPLIGAVPDINIHEIDLQSFPELKGCPLFAVKCTCKHLQEQPSLEYNETHLNQVRLKNFVQYQGDSL